MAELPAEVDKRVTALAGDRESGAADLLDRAIDILRDVGAQRAPLAPVARAICRAQPSMAGMWAVALEAIASERDPARFERFVQRIRRSPAALARFAIEAFPDEGSAAPLLIVTISASRSVITVIDALRARRAVHVSCSESRPALEGRQFAVRLAKSGVPVTLYADAAIGHALTGADAVVIGADAVSPRGFLNKSGTRMLAAAAAQHGVPVYVAATREKFVPPPVAEQLTIRTGAVDEIWDAPPEGVEVRNPYFELTPLDLVTLFISDVGLLGAGMIPDVCSSAVPLEALQVLLR